MHRGVQLLIRWVADHRGHDEVRVHASATSADVLGLEAHLGVPLPTDLRLVLTRFNGGVLPSGTLLRAGTGPGTIEGALRRFAEQLDADFLDPELYLPFHRTVEGSWLCFDRSAGPVSDTWPIVDYYDDTGDVRLMHRTFDGWCRGCVSEWESPDFDAEFDLDKYLRQGQRHAETEPDVATAHATVAHAWRRSGEPDKALSSYLRAARCVPTLPWCDWEALKLAALLRRSAPGFEAASRLASRAPAARWAQRETTPGKVADVLTRLASGSEDRSQWLRLLDQLEEQAWEDDDRERVKVVRRAVARGAPGPTPRADRAPVVPPAEDPEAWWAAARKAYMDGALRDDDILLDASLQPLGAQHDLADLLRIRRDF